MTRSSDSFKKLKELNVNFSSDNYDLFLNKYSSVPPEQYSNNM